MAARAGLALLLVAIAARAGEDTAGARAHFERGMNLYAIERYDEAIKEFEAGFLLKPKPEFLYNIGRAHREAKRPEQAARYFERYVDLAPDAADRAEVEQEIARLRGLTAPATPPAPTTAPAAAPAAPAAPATAPTAPAAAPTAPATAPAAASAAPVPATVAPAASISPTPAVAAPAAGDAPRPIYRRWWLWAGVGAVAVAVGAGVAIGVATRPSTPSADTDLGTFSPRFP